jgi:hypothetical protein
MKDPLTRRAETVVHRGGRESSHAAAWATVGKTRMRTPRLTATVSMNSWRAESCSGLVSTYAICWTAARAVDGCARGLTALGHQLERIDRPQAGTGQVFLEQYTRTGVLGARGEHVAENPANVGNGVLARD